MPSLLYNADSNHSIYLNKFTISGTNFYNTLLITENNLAIYNRNVSLIITNDTIYYLYEYYNPDSDLYLSISSSGLNGENYTIVNNSTQINADYFSCLHSDNLNNIYIISNGSIIIYNITNNVSTTVNNNIYTDLFYFLNNKFQIDDNYIYMQFLNNNVIYNNKFNINNNQFDKLSYYVDNNNILSSSNFSFYNISNNTFYFYYTSQNAPYCLYASKYNADTLLPTSGFPWPMFHANMENTSKSNNLVNELTNPVFIWKYSIDVTEDGLSNLVIDSDGTIYFGTHLGKLIALNTNGSLKWECNLSWEVIETDWVYNEEIDDWEEFTTTITVVPSLASGCPAIATDGTIYVASGDNSAKLFAVNPNGTLKWTYSIVSIHYDQPSALTIDSDGTIIFTSYYTYAINPNGTKKWFNNQDYTKTKPVISGDLVYLFGNPSVYAINKNTGQTIWIKSLGSGGYLYPAYSNQPFIFGDNLGYVYNGVLYARNLLTGEIEWTYTASVPDITIAVGSDGTVYFYNNTNHSLHALTSSGTEKWIYQLTSSTGNIVIDSADNIYFRSESMLYAIDSSGNLVYSKTLNNDIGYTDTYHAPILAIGADGYLYVSNNPNAGKIGGDYTPPTPILPQVQCRATQIIASANTGKIILAVPIL